MELAPDGSPLAARPHRRRSPLPPRSAPLARVAERRAPRGWSGRRWPAAEQRRLPRALLPKAPGQAAPPQHFDLLLDTTRRWHGDDAPHRRANRRTPPRTLPHAPQHALRALQLRAGATLGAPAAGQLRHRARPPPPRCDHRGARCAPSPWQPCLTRAARRLLADPSQQWRRGPSGSFGASMPASGRVATSCRSRSRGAPIVRWALLVIVGHRAHARPLASC